ncbi:MAG: bifunctional DNA-formamidopyrimidine glycosylase/DNA-(apurinic or apyrimidinic site) lyase [Micropruina sp.]|nr:bifunctional DNA-formamidopyrimidine glycosylase/DNA-(apurinic or apyrimidinic site) lyase [Micropruina sp.]
MPELPEVEVVRRGLAAGLRSRTIAAVEVLHPRPVRRHPTGPEGFALTLAGRTFTEPRRRGKFLWLPFADGDALLAHLGMSGQFRFNDASDPLAPNTRVLVDFLDGGPQLRFVDQRMFGGLSISVGGAELPAEVAHIGLDPFDPGFDVERAVSQILARRSGIKRVLLNQEVVSGIGNIYADEALWEARLHYDTPAQSLSRRRARALLVAASQVMEGALAVGGTSFDALYVNVNGASGYFDRSLHAYGREGQACRRCGRPIVREAFMNRSSYRCPGCQRAPRASSAQRSTRVTAL